MSKAVNEFLENYGTAKSIVDKMMEQQSKK